MMVAVAFGAAVAAVLFVAYRWDRLIAAEEDEAAAHDRALRHELERLRDGEDPWDRW
jgi:hypothetical protein